jgi:RecA/RadA recombinase
VAALGAGVYPVVTDELHGLDPRRVDKLRVQFRVLTQPLPEQV